MMAEGRYLLGANRLEDALGFLRRQAECDVPADVLASRAEAAARLRRGRPAPETLEGAEDPPAGWQDHLGRVQERPLFQRLYGDQRWRFARVPIASLVTVQPHLNFSYAAERTPSLSEADVLEVCLPVEPEALELWGGVAEGQPPTASFFTRDPNVQVTGAKVETSGQLRVTFTISKTALFLQVARLGGRLFLKNGTHRAVGLAARGVRHLPCVLVDIPDADSLPRLLPLSTLAGSAPALVTDFLDAQQYLVHPWRSRVKLIRIVPEEFAVPLVPPEDP